MTISATPTKRTTGICKGKKGKFVALGLKPVFGKVGVTTGVAAGVGVSVGVGVCTGGGVGVGVTAKLQTGFVTELVSSVTAPLRARRRPFMEAPVVAVIEVKAIRVPKKLELVPRVADEPTCQKILQACAPLIRLILLPDAVVRVEPI